MIARRTAADTLGAMGPKHGTTVFEPLQRLVSHRRQPSKVAPEYTSPPEIAGTPAPGSAFMSSLGRWPPFDRWRRCGQSGAHLIDDGPGGPKSAPPAINHEERQTMTITTTTGNLTRGPEIRYTRDGQATTSLSVAVNRRWQNRQTQEWEESTSFFDIVCWRDLAENVALSLTKGARVVVTGHLEQRSWETEDGETRSKVELVADDIGASLRFATVDIHKVQRLSTDDELAGETNPA
jgi:single-strand DNA-binding protein